jgi:GT2 family glycosyltransferase/glycosyltransferase involved in cell wall biosynthesis
VHPTVAVRLSVVIVNFRGSADTLECIAHLLEVDWPKEQLEILVVENGSGDGSAETLRNALAGEPGVRIIESSENLGFTGGSNLGAREATGSIIAFLNNDAKPDAQWIRAAMREFGVSPKVAAVGSKVLDWDGKAVDFVTGSLTWFGMGYKEHVTEIDDGRFDEPKDLLFGTGSALFVRADIFAEVGGFDETLFMFYDDVDLGWRLNMLGYRVRFAPDSVVRHKHHGSMKSFGHYREMYLLERNALYVLYKNLSDVNLGSFLPGALSLVARRSVAKSGLDSEMFDIRRFDGSADEFDPEIPVPKEAVAGLFAMDRFVADLPTLTPIRADLQARRQRTDKELFRQFGDMFRPLFDHPYFLEGLENIVSSFDIDAALERRNILVITGDAIGQKMAGPAMRAWKISEALSAQNNVRLVSWNVANRSSPLFDVDRVRLGNEREMAAHETWADVIVFQGHAMHHFKSIRESQKILVIDLYDPTHLEQLEQGREWGTEQWRNQVSSATDVLNEQLLRGDFFLCASERQRLFWLGQLAGLGRVNPDTYASDENLGKLIAIAPFGMDAKDPEHTRNAIRGVTPGIGMDDKVVIWGGGIYNWFDTLTLVRAIAKVAETHDDIRLFFLGVAHPNPDVPEMAIVSKTRELADRLGVAGKNVFFNEQWVQLDDRQNYLLESDLGVSTHYDHVETTLSFRTRILDYMWANLPIVTTRGDSFGDLVAAEGMGVAVNERDVDALANAIISMLYDEQSIAAAKIAVARVRQEFTWEKALEPLVEFCRNPQGAPDRDNTGSKLSERRVKGRAVTQKEKYAHYHEVGTMPKGIARDIALARHYIEYDGVTVLGKRLLSRVGIRAR